MYANAKYMNEKTIRVEIAGVVSFVPVDPDNTDYKNIMALVEAGELTIAPADNP